MVLESMVYILLEVIGLGFSSTNSKEGILKTLKTFFKIKIPNAYFIVIDLIIFSLIYMSKVVIVFHSKI